MLHWSGLRIGRVHDVGIPPDVFVLEPLRQHLILSMTEEAYDHAT
jgi:hypothetical protein